MEMPPPPPVDHEVMMEMELMPPMPQPRINLEVANYKMQKIDKRLKDLGKKHQGLVSSTRSILTLSVSVAVCAAFAGVVRFQVACVNNPKNVACAVAYFIVAFAFCSMAVGGTLLKLSAAYLEKYKKIFIVKLKRKNLKKKRDLIKLGKRQYKIENDNPKFYLVGQLSKTEIMSLAEKKTAQAGKIVVGTFLCFLVTVAYLIFVYIHPCRSPSASPNSQSVPYPSPSASPFP